MRRKPTAIVLTLLIHGLLISLFIFGNRISRRDEKPELVFVSLGVSPQRAAPAVLPPQQSVQRPARRAVARPPADISAPLPEEQATPRETAPTPGMQPGATGEKSAAIDWYGEAAKAAARAGPASKTRTFSEPPKKLREPCKPKVSSFEWHPQEERAGLAPLPYVMLGNCVIGLGFFGCAFDPPPPNEHILDDMAKREHPASVPHAELCD